MGFTHLQIERNLWVGGCRLRSLFSLFSTEFVEPPPNKIPGYASALWEKLMCIWRTRSCIITKHIHLNRNCNFYFQFWKFSTILKTKFWDLKKKFAFYLNTFHWYTVISHLHYSTSKHKFKQKHLPLFYIVVSVKYLSVFWCL
jgi:hypothetical protein